MFENMDWIAAIRTSPVMLVILACSVLTLGFALERMFYFARRRGNPDAVLRNVMEKAREGNVK